MDVGRIKPAPVNIDAILHALQRTADWPRTQFDTTGTIGRMNRNLILVVCLFLGGCAIADFTPYSGAQQNWPVSSGTFVDTKYAVPVFYGTPNRPYVVLGYLNAQTAPVRSRRGAVVAFMARRAQEVGGNGLIVLGTNREYVGSVSSGSAYGNVYGGGFSATGFGTTTPLFGGKGDAVVIRLH